MLLKNCRLIPELSGGTTLKCADILLENDRIKKIVKAGTEKFDEPDVIDCENKTVMPGLFDLHAHISLTSAQETTTHAMERMLDGMSRMRRYTDHGVTTIRDAGSTLRIANHIRNAIARDIIQGPRILSCGYIVAPESMAEIGRYKVMVMDIGNSADELRAAARKEFAYGADFLKIYASGSMYQSINKEPKPLFRDEEVKAMVEIAKMNDSYVAAHAHSTSAIKQCIECGVQSIEHATFIDDEGIDMLVKHDHTYIVPTFAWMMPNGGESSSNRAVIADYVMPKYGENMRKAYLAGVKMGFGCDLMNAAYDAFFQEFRMRKELSNMKNIDILLQATKESALIAGLAGITGEVREGMMADLIVVNGNPDEDIAVMYGKPQIVLQAGVRLR